MIHRHPFLTVLTAGYLAFVGWLTLTPQPIDAADQETIGRILAALHRRGLVESVDYDRLEFLANIGLFVPIGAFLVLLLGARWWWVAVAGCLALTAFIESAQQAIPASTMRSVSTCSGAGGSARGSGSAGVGSVTPPG